MDGERTQLQEESQTQSSEPLQIDSGNCVNKLDGHGSPTSNGASPKYVPPHKRPGFRPTTGEEFSRVRQEAVSATPLNRKLQLVSVGDAVNRPINQMRFQRRPGLGTGGARCIVRTNHFLTDLSESLVHQYDVAISPEVSSQRVNRAVISEMVKLYRQSHLGKRLPAYDGRKSMFTLGPLPFLTKEFRITLSEEEDPGKEREFCVFIKMVACVDLTQIGRFLRGTRAESPHEALQVLDVALRALSAQRYCPVGRSFYSPLLGKMQALGNGVQSWAGFYQSIRPTQMGLSLNIDMSATPFYEPVPVHEFISQFLNRDVSGRPLTDAERIKIKKALKGIKVEVIHRGKLRRQFRVSGLTMETTRDLTFPDNETGNMKSMVEHFQEAYGYVIQEPDWPCLIAGNPRRPCQLPMEVCRIVGGQRYNKKLNEKQVIALLRATCQRPHDRELDIRQIVNQNAYKDDPYAKEFSIEVDHRLTSIDARVLPAPKLKYHESGMEQDCRPHNGQWNMKNKKLIDGGVVKNWICVNFANNVEESVASHFCFELAQMCNLLGMEFNVEPVLPCMTCHANIAERALKAQYHDCMRKLGQDELDLLMVILPDTNGPLYGEIKRICEIELGLASQCCLAKHALKMNKHHLANMALKINAKVGGRNMVLEDALLMRIPMVSDRPTIIIGADVNHPAAGEDISPSIAAVVASQDWPKITKYASLVCTQTHRQEIINDMFKVWEDPLRGVVAGGMIRELLISFRSETGHKPERIIFYRDGVSEGQFQHVLLYEIDAIRKACASLEPNYQPPITFVIVQKRHHTRMFPQNHYDHKYSDRSGNVIPGTVIDTKICHPTEFDFYLCSHAGVQGTSKPAHYHVLYDENNFTADDLQSLTNNLCYTYARCTRAVSIVPPAYYAHLAAFRARFYMEGADNHNRVAVAKPTQSTSAIINAIRALPSLKENAKRIIFY